MKTMNRLDDRRVQSGPRSKTRPLPDPSDPPRAPDPVFQAEGKKKVLTNLEKNPWLNYRFSFSLSFFFVASLDQTFSVWKRWCLLLLSCVFECVYLGTVQFWVLTHTPAQSDCCCCWFRLWSDTVQDCLCLRQNSYSQFCSWLQH